MHTMKVVQANHASSIYKFMNTKIKLLNTNANIYFNRICLEQNITPRCAQVKIHACNKSVIKHIEPKITKIRINNEIEFLCAKKKTLNETLYKNHCCCGDGKSISLMYL
jgi:hypothetical protein